MEHPVQTLSMGYERQGVAGSQTPGGGTVQGTAGTGHHRAFGAGTGQVNPNSNNIKTRHIGSSFIQKIKGGGAVTHGSFNFDHIYDCDPLFLIQPYSGALDFFTVSEASVDGSTVAWHTQDCRAQSLSLRLGGGGAVGVLSGTLNFIGGIKTENTTAETISAAPGNPFTTYDGVFTRGASTAFEIDTFDLSIGWNLEPRFVISGAARTATKVRYWDYLRTAQCDVSGSLTLLEAFPSDVLADVVTSQAMHLRLVDTVASGIIDIQLTGVVADAQTVHLVNQGFETYNVPFTATGFTIANT